MAQTLPQDVELIEMEDDTIYIQNYSERSFVAFGLATKEHKDLLKERKGGYNRNLTDPNTGERFSGWIFPMKRRGSVISDLIMKDIKYVDLDA